MGLCFMATMPVANAGCLDDLKKYQLGSDIYEECVKEADKGDSSEVQYLVAMWNLYGVNTPSFQKNENHIAYKHFIYLAAKNGDMNAKATYVTTEYSVANKDADVNLGRFLKDLSEDKTNEGVLRYLKVKLAIKTFDDKEDLETLKKLAANKKNIEANYELGAYLQSKAQAVIYDNTSINVALPYYDVVLSASDSITGIDMLKAKIYWNLFNYYSESGIKEVAQKAIPNLEKLSYMGDILAQIYYAEVFMSKELGQYDEIKAYAWSRLAKECGKTPLFAGIENKISDQLTLRLSEEDLKKAHKELEDLKKKVPCKFDRAESLPKKPQATTSAPKDKNSDKKDNKSDNSKKDQKK